MQCQIKSKYVEYIKIKNAISGILNLANCQNRVNMRYT